MTPAHSGPQAGDAPPPFEIPVLETARLRLRSFRDEDLDDYAALCADPEVMRYLGTGQTLGRAEAWRQMAFILGHWRLRGFGLWAVEARDSGELLGRIGHLHPEGWPGFEVAWTLARPHWGKGYATEGARAAVAYAFAALGRDRVISLIHPENRASIRVAERIGERPTGRAEVFGHEVIVYELTRQRWADEGSGGVG